MQTSWHRPSLGGLTKINQAGGVILIRLHLAIGAALLFTLGASIPCADATNDASSLSPIAKSLTATCAAEKKTCYQTCDLHVSGEWEHTLGVNRCKTGCDQAYSKCIARPG